MNIKVTDWQKDKSAIQFIRRKVFIDELGMDADKEFDSQDINATHLILEHQRHPVAYLRITNGYKISKIAVLAQFRQQKIASQLLTKAEKIISRQNHKRSELIGSADSFFFFQKNGYITDGSCKWLSSKAHMKFIKLLYLNLPQGDQFQLNIDKETYCQKNKNEIASALCSSLFLIAISQCQQQIRVHFNSDNHLALIHQQTLSGLINFLTASRKTSISIEAHALNQNIQLTNPLLNYYASRAKNRFRLKQDQTCSKKRESLIIFDNKAYLLFSQHNLKFKPSCTRSEIRHLEQFYAIAS